MRRLLLTTVVFAVLVCTGIARGEIFGGGDLRLSFKAGFAPKTLPRDRIAPVAVRLGGSIGTSTGARPPELRRISIAVNRYGLIFSNGLPTCNPGLLESTSSEEALSRCHRALIGHGRVLANVTFPNIEPFPVDREALAFNGRVDGKPAILLHVYGRNPVKTTLVVVFRITHPSKGQFGTVFSAKIPPIASDLGSVTEISMLLDRKYRYEGKLHSFASARCAAPAGLHEALFTFVKGTFIFSNGQKLTPSLVRTCRVR
jgi:hypothetical protein